MLPATKAVPKALIPLLGKPLVQYTVEELVEAGIRDIGIFVTPFTASVRDHFSEKPNIRAHLRERGDGVRQAILDHIADLASIRYFEFPAEGFDNGDALACVQDFVGSEAFAFTMADEVASPGSDCILQLIAAAQVRQVSTVGVIGEVSDGPLFGVQSLTLRDRDTNASAPERACGRRPRAVGRYVLTHEIFAALDAARRADQPMELIEALQILARRGRLTGCVLDEPVWDCGSIEGLVEATIALAARQPELRLLLERYAVNRA